MKISSSSCAQNTALCTLLSEDKGHLPYNDMIIKNYFNNIDYAKHSSTNDL